MTPAPTATTELGIGCAELFREPRATARRRLLGCALEAGIRHFDVAPMYGLGVAEAELGRFARGRRDQLVIATKFGIATTPAARAIARLQGPARRMLAASPALRARARASAAGPSDGGVGSFLYRSIGYDAAAARASLERSLRALGTDYVDLLLLHDPLPGLIALDELCAELERARTSGAVRAWGVAGEYAATLAVAAELPIRPPALQVREDLRVWRPALHPLPDRLITFGVLGGPIAAIRNHVNGAVARRRRWEEAVGADCADPEVLAGLLLRRAAAANPAGVVLFGTIRPSHITAAPVALAGAVGDLDAFAGLLASELGYPTNPRAEA